MGHNALTRVIRHAEARDLVGRNVATLVDSPKSQAGRPSKSLTLDQAFALLAAATDARMRAYIALCLVTGIRTDEARALLRARHLRRSKCRPACPGQRCRLAIGAGPWPHQNREVPQNPSSPPDGPRCPARLQDQQPADRHMAGALWSWQDLVFPPVRRRPGRS
jgi:hypothetical protein